MSEPISSRTRSSFYSVQSPDISEENSGAVAYGRNVERCTRVQDSEILRKETSVLPVSRTSISEKTQQAIESPDLRINEGDRAAGSLQELTPESRALGAKITTLEELERMASYLRVPWEAVSGKKAPEWVMQSEELEDKWIAATRIQNFITKKKNKSKPIRQCDFKRSHADLHEWLDNNAGILRQALNCVVHDYHYNYQTAKTFHSDSFIYMALLMRYLEIKYKLDLNIFPLIRSNEDELTYIHGFIQNTQIDDKSCIDKFIYLILGAINTDTYNSVYGHYVYKLASYFLSLMWSSQITDSFNRFHIDLEPVISFKKHCKETYNEIPDESSDYKMAILCLHELACRICEGEESMEQD